MALVQTRKFKISVEKDSGSINTFQVGDIVRRQYGDIASTMCVVEVSEKFFIGILLDGDAPQTSELLDFVRVTNLWDANRLGALYLTSTDDDAPYLDVIDGVAVEKSMNFPSAIYGDNVSDAYSQYRVLGRPYLSVEHTQSLDGQTRVCSLTKNSIISSGAIGISQRLFGEISTEDKIIVSYKCKSSRPIQLNTSLGYEDGSQTDGQLTHTTSEEWQYHCLVYSLDSAERHARKVDVVVSNELNNGDILQIADFNVIKLSSVLNYGSGSKVRIGRLSGVDDAVFGNLRGYGAYIQNLYATNGVNVSGTLTAGDENGFSSTFYAGKIHKNVIANSLRCALLVYAENLNEVSPSGVGDVCRTKGKIEFFVQSSQWWKEKVGKQYVFSIWLRSQHKIDAIVKQNGVSIGTLNIEGDSEFHRYSVSFRIQEWKENGALKVSIDTGNIPVSLSSPQMEEGSAVSQYQATDEVLNYTSDYGAWFNKGGIGGTIQNPLLRLSDDGSISSRDNSFVINQDGTGSLAKGKIRWDKDNVFFKGVTLKWEDFDDTIKDALKPKSIRIFGDTEFLVDGEVSIPESIQLNVEANGFDISQARVSWKCLNKSGNYSNISDIDSVVIRPNELYWEDRASIKVKCDVEIESITLSDVVEIKKRTKEESYIIRIESSKGNVFRNGVIDTILTAYLFNSRGLVQIPENSCTWTRSSKNADEDKRFNDTHVGVSNSIQVSDIDENGLVQYQCTIQFK